MRQLCWGRVLDGNQRKDSGGGKRCQGAAILEEFRIWGWQEYTDIEVAIPPKATTIAEVRAIGSWQRSELIQVEAKSLLEGENLLFRKVRMASPQEQISSSLAHRQRRIRRSLQRIWHRKISRNRDQDPYLWQQLTRTKPQIQWLLE